ncbi:hypothetical protein BDM02DRAFT_1855413 [Thelephora ganbajun]|uniref:Uncharacterized protein n=1 Tax=Thelephora ganbajun TaxID=370292 RepID=A0ACB6ZIS3_THEGA|nr:hypothetical protein BDM02DRAFT_1855413 [Thelephora ganbajun]
MAEHDLFKYARRLNVRMGSVFYPHVLLEPHLQHFQSPDRIHTFTIHSYQALLWCDVYNAYFTQFHPILATLVLSFSTSYCRYVLYNSLTPRIRLSSLCVTRPGFGLGYQYPPSLVSLPPTHMDTFNVLVLARRVPCKPAFSPPNGINFRSVEFRDVYWEPGQRILDVCVSSLEGFIVRINGKGEKEPRSLPRFFRVTETERTGSHFQCITN